MFYSPFATGLRNPGLARAMPPSFERRLHRRDTVSPAAQQRRQLRGHHAVSRQAAAGAPRGGNPFAARATSAIHSVSAAPASREQRRAGIASRSSPGAAAAAADRALRRRAATGRLRGPPRDGARQRLQLIAPAPRSSSPALTPSRPAAGSKPGAGAAGARAVQVAGEHLRHGAAAGWEANAWRSRRPSRIVQHAPPSATARAPARSPPGSGKLAQMAPGAVGPSSRSSRRPTPVVLAEPTPSRPRRAAASRPVLGRTAPICAVGAAPPIAGTPSSPASPQCQLRAEESRMQVVGKRLGGGPPAPAAGVPPPRRAPAGWPRCPGRRCAATGTCAPRVRQAVFSDSAVASTAGPRRASSIGAGV